MKNITAIKLIFENGDKELINKSNYEDLYIANIDNLGSEIEYSKTIINNILYANLFILKLKKEVNTNSIINRIKMKNDVTQVELIFDNKKFLKFELASSADPFEINYDNSKQYTLDNENYFGLVLSKNKLKYLNNIFI